jgi:hypothetical protein
MTATLADGSEARRVAQPFLLAQHARLSNVRIVWAFSDAKPPKKFTCKAFAAITILTPLHRYLSAGGGGEEEAADVAIVFNRVLWDACTPVQQRWVVDDALEHIWLDEDDALSLREHDIEAFSGVLERQGIPFDSMRHAARVIRQLGAEALG